MIRRINLFGGPGIGKSTTASKLFSSLKENQKSVELVQEYIKDYAYQGKKINDYDELEIFSNQLKSELLKLRHVNYIVTDSPLLAQYTYGTKIKEEILSLSRKFEKDYPSINIFLKRQYAYEQLGRYQTELEAIHIDKVMFDFLKSCEYSYGIKLFESSSFKETLELVAKWI